MELVSPNVNYEYGAYHMEPDGNVDLSNWSIDYSYGRSSPGPGYVSYSSCQVESDGSIGSYGTVVGDSYGRKYSVTLRLPTQLETVYCILKLMAEVI